MILHVQISNCIKRKNTFNVHYVSKRVRKFYAFSKLYFPTDASMITRIATYIHYENTHGNNSRWNIRRVVRCRPNLCALVALPDDLTLYVHEILPNIVNIANTKNVGTIVNIKLKSLIDNDLFLNFPLMFYQIFSFIKENFVKRKYETCRG